MRSLTKRLPHLIVLAVALVAATQLAGSGQSGKLQAVELAGSPAPNVVIRRTTIGVPPHEAEGDFATCGSGERATGGGAGGGSADAIVLESGPSDTSNNFTTTETGDVPRKWFASVGNFDATPPGGTAYVFALCARESNVIVRRKAVPVPSGQTRTGVKPCAPDERATGGGAGFDNGGLADDVSTSQSGPTDSTGTFTASETGDVPRKWFASVHNSSPTERTAYVFAVCARASNVVIRRKAFTVFASSHNGAAKPCASGELPTGGGVGFPEG